MRAVICRDLSGPSALVLEDLPRPEPGEGEVLIRVHAAGVNFADSLVTAGKYQEKHQPPFTPGFEAAGIIEAVGPGVASCRPGERVMATLSKGGFADYAIARASDVHAIPDRMDFVTAAGFPIAWGTSHYGLVHRCGLKAGEVLLVHGAAGGVGLTAVEVGAALGATVIATAGGPEKLAVAQAHGATHLIDYKSEDIRERVKEITGGRGADVVYDPVGGNVFDASLRCTAPNGRILVVGFAGGNVPQIPANILLVKNITVIGYYWGAYRQLDPEGMRASFRQLMEWYEQGRLKPLVSASFDLADTPAAIESLLSRKSTGKVVITTGAV
ncbi:NADPH:quinone oxidoreductase family protein [Telmatospirillum sp. J64-1]|uniref:NADPH:quinone oxidoreductase family protein n=1 Tax=Telmatospirillum sp. J64-1 TaxID=2502183 RepID=UPI00115D9EB6|nr:NADPH:quinone oxidoreductase family protein [Telmatospirillum sp. J64-1]